MANMPQTRLQLFKLDNCDSTYEYVSNFVVKTVDEYFNDYPTDKRYELLNIQYIRKNGIIDLPLIYDIAEDFNYCRYDNGEGRGWEYAFITEKQFINFNMTRVKTKFDVWNNYLDHIKQIRFSHNNLIIRQHQDPSIFSNILSDLPAVANLSTPYFNIDDDTVVMLHIVLKAEAEKLSPYYDSVKWIDFEISQTEPISPQVLDILNSAYAQSAYIYFIPRAIRNKFVDKTVTASRFGIIDEIISILPGYDKKVLGLGYDESTSQSPFDTIVYDEDINTLIKPQEYVDDKKILTYPYTILTLKTSIQEIELNPAMFNNLQIRCSLSLSSSGASIIYYCIDKYGHKYYIKDRGLNIPISTSAFEEWAARNQNFALQQMLSFVVNAYNSQTNATNQGISATTSFFSGNYISALSSARGMFNEVGGFALNSAANMAQTVLNIDNMKRAPYNVFTPEDLGESIMIMDGCYMKFYNKVCDNDTSKRIQAYWNKYGYPYSIEGNIRDALRTRKYYNYLMVEDFYSQDIYCEEDRLALSSIFSNGVHIYHIADDYLIYGETLNNTLNYYVGG